MNRREILKTAGFAGTGLFLNIPSIPPSEDIFLQNLEFPSQWSEEEVLQKTRWLPNRSQSLYNYSVIPERPECKPFVYHAVCRHRYSRNEEAVFMAGEYPDFSLHGYEGGVKAAIGRNQKVHLAVGLPVQHPGWENLRRYFRKVATEYPADLLIIGNEFNITGQNDELPESYWGRTISDYAQAYKIASEEIRQATQGKTKVSVYGEAHWGQGRVLRNVLQALKQISVRPDAASFHFYSNDMSELQNRTWMYEAILTESGIGKIPLYLTELGNEEREIKDSEQANVVLQGLATSLMLVEQKQLEHVIWSVAMDPGKPEISLWREYSKGRQEPREAGWMYLLGSRIYAKIAGFFYEHDLIRVQSYASDGTSVVTVWNTGDSDRSISYPKNTAGYDHTGKRLSKEEQPVALGKAENTLVFLEER